MMDPEKCVLCNGKIEKDEVTCVYCDEFLSTDDVLRVSAMVRRFNKGEMFPKRMALFLAAMRDVRDANYLCDLYLPDIEQGEAK